MISEIAVVLEPIRAWQACNGSDLDTSSRRSRVRHSLALALFSYSAARIALARVAATSDNKSVNPPPNTSGQRRIFLRISE